MTASVRNDLVADLRKRLSDDRASVGAFSLQVTGNCRSASLEIANGHLCVTVEGGEDVRSIRFPLSSPLYSTIGSLSSAISGTKGYAVANDAAINMSFPSSELRVEGFPDISNQRSYTFRHNVFSTDELRGFLEDAIAAHNSNYTLSNVPAAERHLVLYKAVAAANRALASDAVRRKSIDSEPSTLISIAQDAEAQYDRDRERQARVIPVPKADETRIGTGDVIVGRLTRFSLRRGYNAEARSAVPPQPPVLLEPEDVDITDVTVRLRWQPMREIYFVRFELWRDTKPDVERSLSGQAVERGLPTTKSQYSRPTTAKRVSGWGLNNGMSGRFDGVTFGIHAEFGMGTQVPNTVFEDGLTPGDPLRPEFTYYYRLYGMNTNGEVNASDVLRVKTKKQRALFKRSGELLASDAITPQTGPLAGGTSIVILGNYFEPGTRVEIGGAPCTITTQTDTQLTVLSPAVNSTAFSGVELNIVLISPTKLEDIAYNTWRYE
jgi:IPT/TIG domain